MATPIRDEDTLDRKKGDIPSGVHPQVTDPAKVPNVPLGAKVDDEGIIHIGADGRGAE